MGLKLLPPPGEQSRAYVAGQINRFTGGEGTLIGSSRSIGAELRISLRNMRSHSRTLYQNNDYCKKFARLLIKNIPGPNGIRLQNKAKFPGGGLDTAANKIIETGFQKWGKRGNCDVTGRLSWREAQWLFIQTVAIDGECFVRKVKNFKGNAFRFALQFIEADQVDETLYRDLPNGNTIRMGIEYDSWGKAVSYHVLTNHPGDWTYSLKGNRYEIIPASEMIHGFLTERAEQGRGVPWTHTSVSRLHNLGGFEDAAVIAKRTAASKMGFLIPPVDADPDDYDGDDKDEAGNIISEVEPGLLEQLPPGWTFAQFAPAEPGGDFDAFVKRTLKGIAAGLDVAYHKLASDLEGVSYSSARQGELDDRDTWRLLQFFESESFCETVLSDWLEIQLLYGKTLLTANGNALPYSKYDQFNAATWIPRGWDWVDPVKDIVANLHALNHGLTTRTRIEAECGGDYADLLEEMEAEKKQIEDKKFSVVYTFNGPLNKTGGSTNAANKNA